MSRPWAVIKDADGSIEGCHASEEMAKQHQAALYASEGSTSRPIGGPMNEERAVWTAAYINDLPDSAFLHIEAGGEKDEDGRTTPRSLRHFPYKDADGSVDLPHLRNALARIPQSSLPADVKERVSAKARRILQEQQSSATSDGTELRFAPAPDSDLEVRDNEGAMPTLAGHFAVFNEWTQIASRYEGDFMERIAPGAFAKTFAENRRNMRVLFQHGKDPHIGEKVLGPIVELREEAHGAYFEVPLYDTEYNRELIPALRDGQYGSSFRFRVMKEDFPSKRPEPSDFNPDGLRERTITEAKVMEFGPVTFPAYEGASAGLRSATDWWLEQNLLSLIEKLAGRAAALNEDEKPTEVTSLSMSRRTHVVDHLASRKEDKPWRL